MKTSSHLTLFFVILFASVQLNAQNAIPVLGWKTNFSYKNVKQLASSQDFLFAATENTLFSVEKNSGLIERLNKNTGLSDVGIGAIQTLDDQSSLIIGYKNGNIDILSGNSIQNITTVKDFETTQSKEFKSIQVNGSDIYLAGQLGIIVYNTQRNEVAEAYQALGEGGKPLAVNDLIIYNDSIFAATANGIMAASLSNDINRQDFNNWQRTLPGISFEEIENTNFGLFASSESDLFIRDNQWVFYQNYPEKISDIEGNDDVLFLSTEVQIVSLSDNDSEIIYQLEEDSEAINNILNDGAYLWIGSYGSGLFRFTKSTEAIDFFSIPGPNTDLAYSSEHFDGKLYSVPSTFSNLNTESHFNIYDTDDNSWLSPETIIDNNSIPNILDVGELSGETYFVSYNLGLFKRLEDGSIVSLMSSNSGPSNSGVEGYQMTSIALDENAVFWTTFYDKEKSLYSYNPSTNEWQEYLLSNELARFAIDLFIGPNGDKWLTIDPEEGGGIIIFNEESRDERYLNLNGGQGGLPSNEVTDLETDQDLFVWVGTSQGIAFFTNPFNILEGRSLTASVPIFENRLLLRNEFISDLAIDPANRKWFGTRNNGLWLFSETGEELIYHFTINNSPLPSNRIISLAIEPTSGQLYITTDKGAITFRSDATQGTDRHENVKVYPNPVNRDFQGQIVIEGLVNNAQIKITDVSGKLVKDFRANGSTAIWDGRDLNNSRVKTGVYLVFSAGQDGLETYVAKIVVI